MVCLEVLTAISLPVPYADSAYDFTMRSSDDIMRELLALLDAMPNSPDKENRRLVAPYEKLPVEMQRSVQTSLGYRRAYCIDLPANPGDPYGIGASLLPHIERLIKP